jgi:hypothetical protein
MKMLTLASGLIALALVFSIILAVPQVYAQTSCDYYASPNGTGNGISPSTPFQISKFWSIATPGKTLCLLDGTYTGENSMIVAPSTFAGTAAQPITIRALNEGKVLIDGGTSRPVNLQGSYGILEGVNVQGGDNATLATRGDHWFVRRVVVWSDTSDTVSNMLDVGGTNNTIEDCAVFGKGRKLLTAGAAHKGPSNNTIRRCWVQWEERVDPQSPSVPCELGYAQDNVIMENLICTYNVQGYVGSADPPFTIFRTQNSKLLGSIAYETATSNPASGGLLITYRDDGYQSGDDPHPVQGNLIKDVVTVMAPNNAQFSSYTPVSLHVSGPNETAPNVVDNVLGIGGQPNACGTWQGCRTMKYATSHASMESQLGMSIWQAVPGVCRRYVNGTLTSQPLWPWPMDQRIKDAMMQSGRAPVDVTQTIEGMFGPLPKTCTTGDPLPAEMPAPRNLHVIGAN